LRQTLRITGLMAIVVAAAPACGTPFRDVEPTDKASKPAADPSEKPVTIAPIPLNQRFRTLDEYLAFRKKGAAIDKAWYREIRPGVYQLETGNYRPLGGDDQKRIFTREELMREYGFTR
jgi:hypothetical protein